MKWLELLVILIVVLGFLGWTAIVLGSYGDER